MIKRLVVDNLKSIDHVELPCTNLNLFVGTNSSGKSTILQALLLFAQNVAFTQGLSGEFVSLGTYDESKCLYSNKQSIEIFVVNKNENSAGIQFGKLEKGYSFRKLTEDFEEVVGDTFDSEKRKIQYLSCHRIGPQNLYKKNMNMTDTIGSDGSFAMSYLNAHASEPLDKDMCKNSQDFTLLGQVNWWLKYIVDVEVETEEIIGADALKASYSTDSGVRVRPQNIGSGISYLISVIIICFAAPEDSIIVLENPEIHLHPTAQSKVCDFLYFISKHNRQLFIETHSDHIFNGFRAGIATGEIEQEIVKTYFVSLNNEHTTDVELVKFGRFGRIENQRKDLFDQFDIDMNKMIGV